jgi:aspartyl-tRNA(Asn)/glutamyl-tRNA(Gln) amidotransferase subunit C
MPDIDQKLVKYVARLSQLELNDDEIEYYEQQMKRVLGYIEQITKIPAEYSTSTGVDSERITPERDDVTCLSLSPDEVMSQAPAKVGTSFIVPRMIE